MAHKGGHVPVNVELPYGFVVFGAGRYETDKRNDVLAKIESRRRGQWHELDKIFSDLNLNALWVFQELQDALANIRVVPFTLRSFFFLFSAEKCNVPVAALGRNTCSRE